jgi:hypothetical protein
VFPFYFGNRQPEPDPVAEDEPVVDADHGGVNAWRLLRLLDAGWPLAEAELLAEDRTVDLHQACELLERGCDVTRAWEILT